jgi:endonuclease YncB( thermonuclease family)
VGRRTERAAILLIVYILVITCAASPTATCTATPQVVCTPPPCDFEKGEVYYCPGECPGGCGTQCATATPGPPTLLPESTSTTTTPTSSYQTAAVTRIIDGDTIEVEIEGRPFRLRYIGMDTPERGRPFFSEATEANRRLVEGQMVFLEKDISETDRYGRLLRYVYLLDGTMVNAELVRQGYAQVATYPPDVKYQDVFVQLQREAREAERGLWGVSGAATLRPILAPTPTPMVAATQQASGVVIESVFYDGIVKSVESDEYAVIANTGDTSVNKGSL